MDLRRDLCGRVLLDDAHLRLDDLAERPERDAVPVGETASLAPRDELGLGIDDPLELVHEAALTDPGNAYKGQEVRCALIAGARKRIADEPKLARAPDELRARLVGHVDAEPRMGGPRLPDRDRLRLALRIDRLGRRVVDRGARRPVCHLVDENAVDRRRRLQARGGVDDVTRTPCPHRPRVCVELNESFARRDADA